MIFIRRSASHNRIVHVNNVKKLTIAANSEGNVVIAYQTNSPRENCCMAGIMTGEYIDWNHTEISRLSMPGMYPSCPTVSINTQGLVVATQSAFNPFWLPKQYKTICHVGLISYDDHDNYKVKVLQKCRKEYDFGCCPAIAIDDENTIVEIHESDVVPQIHLHYHVGSLFVSENTSNPCTKLRKSQISTSSTEDDGYGTDPKFDSLKVETAQSVKATLSVSGVPVTHSQQVTIDHETRTLSEWSHHGLKIHIPPGALPETESECTFTLGVTCTTSDFRFSPDLVLVSPMFYIKPSVKLLKPVTLEIEHCCDIKSEKDAYYLKPMLASTTSGCPPYTFQPMEGGKFPIEGSWGYITTSSFTWYGTFFEWLFPRPATSTGTIIYFARFFIQQVNRTCYRIVISLSRNLEQLKLATSDDYPRTIWNHGIQFEFQFKENDCVLSFDMPAQDELINGGWKITPAFSPCQVKQNNLNNAPYLSREFTARWENEEASPGKLVYNVRMNGVDKTQFEISIYPQLREATIEEEPEIALSEAFKILLPVASKWKNIGAILGLDDQIQTISADNPSSANDGLQEMVRVWLKRKNPKPTWDELANAVKPFDEKCASKIQKHQVCS